MWSPSARPGPISRRLALWTMGVATVAACACASVAAQEANRYHLKPGASGKACLSCHLEFEDTVKLPHVHTPVKAGNCTDCHDPHASDHGKLLEADTDAICVSCHEGIVPDGAVSAHPDAVAGRCVECHDPHASRFPNVLRASGNDLCKECHENVTGAVESAAYKHAPAQGDCLGCHRPHASTEGPHLLAQKVPGLCIDCHDTERPQFVKDHLGYPVAESDCGSCHDPHGSANKGILWASVHEPIRRRMCGQCHADPDSEQALSLKRPGADLCVGCHNELSNEIALKSRIHWPVVDEQACANCHNPHASRNANLLAGKQSTLCGNCHQDSVQRHERSLVKHQPISEGDCSTCHAPHASNATYLLAASDDIELCGTCHEWQAHSTHPIGAKVLDPRNNNLSVDCLSCHRTHGTGNEKLAFFEPKRDLCTECHVRFQR